jgi:hypothetical protein
MRTLFSLRRGLPLLALAVVFALLGEAAAQDEGFTQLFNGKDMTGWKFEVGKGDAAKVFTVADGKIVVSGSPNGYFYTDKSYKNYVLRFDWQYPKKSGNSGLLVHIQPPHKVWPKCVEVQGQHNDHGRIFAIGGAKGKFDVDKEAQKKAIKGVGEWNTTEVTCDNGKITSKVNGTQVGTGSGELMEGAFGFQSEGVELWFKNIRIKETK